MKRSIKQIGQMISAIKSFKSIKAYGSFLALEDWMALAMSTKFRILKKNEVLCKIGETAIKVYFLVAGRVSVFLDNSIDLSKDHSKDSNLIIIPPGNTVGEIGVLYGIQR